MDKREKSRQEWEEEIRARQRNLLPLDVPEGLRYVRMNGRVPRIRSLVRFVLGNVIIALGLVLLSWNAWIAAGAIAGGVCVVITAIRWKSEKSDGSETTPQ